MQTVEVKPGELVEYEGNVKIHSTKQIDVIKESIQEFGFVNPVVAWHNANGEAEIVCGHGRVEAALLLGLETIPVVFVDHLNDDQRRALTLVDNQTTLMTGLDEEKLKAEIERIKNIDFEKYNFNVEEIEQVEFTQDEVMEEVEERCKEGQIWELGEHRLACGSCLDYDLVKKLMGEEKAYLLLTDPPYGVNYQGGIEQKRKKIENDNLRDEEFLTFLTKAFGNAKSFCHIHSSFYIWFADTRSVVFKEALEKNKFQVKSTLMWIKNHFTLGRGDYQHIYEACFYGYIGSSKHFFINSRALSTLLRDDKLNPQKASKEELQAWVENIQKQVKTDVMYHDRPMSSKLHPTMKPVGVFGECIVNSSKVGEIVIDPFAGSGTTIIACEQAGRKARCVELDPHYCDVIINRWEEETGGTAKLL